MTSCPANDLSLSLLPASERPRERLQAMGPGALSDTELLTILVGSGTAGASAPAVAQGLLAAFGGLFGVAGALPSELQNAPGIGEARACVLQAAFELGRRVSGKRPCRGRPLGRASDVWTHLRARLALLPVEEFWALGLDVRNRVQIELCVARGSLTGVEVHPRDVFRPLIRAAVASVIFCHNHPSGDPSPSRQDIELTDRLRKVGELCGISVLDHVVVASEGFTSFAERGWA
ncbi:MAG: DNA repair protein RadC [Myxococcales bacterium]|nr:DNA repair protein RadC [Myxococcales bacterium]